ncbi:hypothetical protein [Kitasatospora sp. GP82]|uniref:hypothetical protein n=1 Tax=Kitasatospora sp. GP82 TaxID=3035089 RepID=UPI0024750D40|nr:hypothetical protein [Kitasatospora sp. GP82]MDH6127444.1 hypothetical protein [Kitasatospora sp. GP82]
MSLSVDVFITGENGAVRYLKSARNPDSTARDSTRSVSPCKLIHTAKYRAAHGEEITAVFAEAVQYADRRTALREWATLAAHAVRPRTRLSSRDPAGRIRSTGSV